MDRRQELVDKAREAARRLGKPTLTLAEFGREIGIGVHTVYIHFDGWRDLCRRTFGDGLDFRALRHAPVNEHGVVLLFGMVAGELGFLVEAVAPGFPDCEGKRRLAPGRWERVRIEFEYQSRSFRDHGHDPAGCDLVVCWEHNWPDCPVEVLALKTAIETLPAAMLPDRQAGCDTGGQRG